MGHNFIEENEETLAGLKSNLLDEGCAVKDLDKGEWVKARNLLGVLKTVKDREADNPFFAGLLVKMTRAVEVLEKLIRLHEFYKKNQNLLEKLETGIVKTLNRSVLEVVKKVEAWERQIQTKMNVVGKGNKHLHDFPIHKMMTRFYAKVKEFNADATLVLRHPLNEMQKEMVRTAKDEDLISIMRKIRLWEEESLERMMILVFQVQGLFWRRGRIVHTSFIEGVCKEE